MALRIRRAARIEEYMPGDGGREVVLRFEPGGLPTVMLNNVQQTVGIKGVDAGKQWYWAMCDRLLTRDRAGGVLAKEDLITVSYPLASNPGDYAE